MRPIRQAASQQRWSHALLVFGGLLSGVLLGEVAIRLVEPSYSTMVIDPAQWKVHLSQVDGVPVWASLNRDQTNQECVANHPNWARILFFGDSITFGFSPRGNVVPYPALLEGRLNRVGATASPGEPPRDGFCALNFAQNSFGFAQSWALAQREIPRQHPALVVWQTWDERRDFTLLGSAAYDLGGYLKDAEGFPFLSRWIPRSFEHAMFLHSRLYRHVVLSFGRRCPSWYPEPDEIAARYRQLKAVCDAEGAPLLVVVGAPLSGPFRDNAPRFASSPQEYPAHLFHETIRSLGIPLSFFADELADLDYRNLRADECCHLNAAGHVAVADRFEPIIRSMLNHG